MEHTVLPSKKRQYNIMITTVNPLNSREDIYTTLSFYGFSSLMMPDEYSKPFMNNSMPNIIRNTVEKLISIMRKSFEVFLSGASLNIFGL